MMLSLLLCIGCFAGCGASKGGDEETEEIIEDELVLGDEDADDDDEGDVIEKTESTSNGGSNNGGSGSGSAVVGNGSAGNVNMDKNLAEKLKGTTVKVLWWKDFTATEKELIKKFEKETGMKVEYKYAANDAAPYTELIASAMAGKEGYDVAMFNYTSFPFRPLTTMQPMEKISNFKASDWDQEIVNAYKINGHTYGVNINGSNYSEYVVMYYNKSMFQRAKQKTPREYWEANNWNWDTFMDCAKNMTKKNSDGSITYGYVNLFAQSVSYWTAAGGTDFISYNPAKSQFTANIGNATLEKSLQQFLTIANRGYMDRTLPYGVDTFRKGDAAMFSCISFFMMKDVSGSFGNMKDEIDAVPFPMPKGQKQKTLMDASAFGILQGSKNPEGAIEFLKYFLNPSNYNKGGNFLNNNLKDTYAKISAMPKIIPYTAGVMNGAALADYSPMSQLICKSDLSQVKATLEKYKNQFNMSVEKANKKVKNTK